MIIRSLTADSYSKAIKSKNMNHMRLPFSGPRATLRGRTPHPGGLSYSDIDHRRHLMCRNSAAAMAPQIFIFALNRVQPITRSQILRFTYRM